MKEGGVVVVGLHAEVTLKAEGALKAGVAVNGVEPSVDLESGGGEVKDVKAILGGDAFSESLLPSSVMTQVCSF